MSILYYRHWTNDIPIHIEEQRPERVVIFGETEWEMWQINKEFVDRATELGTELTIVHGCFISDHHINHYQNAGLPLKNVVFWGTHFFNYVYMLFVGSTPSTLSNYRQHTFKHKFISLNNRSHLHRCMFIEEMSKQNLLDEGVVTWIAHLNENSDFPYQHFDGKQRLLSDGFAEHLNSYSLPIEWYDSLFEIITESTNHVHFFTEKTIRNLLFKKPFVILGAKGMHSKLVELGFKLYDEVIDYSFDAIDDLQERTRLFVNNIHNILKYDPKELYELLMPKLIYNYNRAMTIITDMSLVPKVFKDMPDNDVFKFYQSVTFKRIKYLSIWNSWVDSKDPDQIDKHVNGEISVDQYKMIVIHQAVEHAYNNLGSYDNGVDLLVAHAKHHSVPVKLITSTRTYENESQLSIESDQYQLLDNIDCPGYWLAESVCQAMPNRAENMQNGLDITDHNVNLNHNIDTLYITMNNLAHNHRCLMMDLLAKHNLIDSGAIAWRDILRCFDNDRNEIPDSLRIGYRYKYWTPERLSLDYSGLESYINQAVLPPQYKHAFMQLVNESTLDTFFLTEKTGFALLYNKIFLVIGAKNFHKNLVDMGFKLYDRLFDYSFDSIDDDEARIEGIIENINKYRNHSMEELEVLLNQNIDVIKHNRQVALDYALNKVPNSLKLVHAQLSGMDISTSLDHICGLTELKDEFSVAKI